MEKGISTSREMKAIKAWHTLSLQTVADELRTDLDAGLKVDEAACRRTQEGPNELPEAPPPSLLKLFISQFASVLVWVLIGAAIVSGLLEDWIDAAAILAIVFLNGVLGVRAGIPSRVITGGIAQVVGRADGLCHSRKRALQSIPARDWSEET